MYVQYISELVNIAQYYTTCIKILQLTLSPCTSLDTEVITADPRGIPGWDKVGQLAEELVGLTGIAVSAVQAESIKALCNALDDYNKSAIEVHFTSQQSRLRGHFCSWKVTGHITIEQMRR